MFHDPVRRAELTLGAFGGILTLVAIAIGALVPSTSSTLSVYRGGQLVQYAHSTTSLFQFLGTGFAGGVISTFVVLGVVFAATAILHAHARSPVQAHRELAFEWVVGALLVLFAWVTSILFIFLFIPSVVVVVATLVVSTSRHLTRA